MLEFGGALLTLIAEVVESYGQDMDNLAINRRFGQWKNARGSM